MVDGSGMKARDAGDREMARAVKLTALSGTPIGRCLSSGWRLLCRTPLEWAIKSTQEKGLIQTGKVVGTIAMDLWFDWKYRTDTCESLDFRKMPYLSTSARVRDALCCWHLNLASERLLGSSSPGLFVKSRVKT
jgi:hypothetical protein